MDHKMTLEDLLRGLNDLISQESPSFNTEEVLTRYTEEVLTRFRNRVTTKSTRRRKKAYNRVLIDVEKALSEANFHVDDRVFNILDSLWKNY